MKLTQWLNGIESTCNARDTDLNPGLGRSPRVGNGNPLQYSHLGNPKDRGAWWSAVYEVTKSQTWLTKQQQFTTSYSKILTIIHIKVLWEIIHTHEINSSMLSLWLINIISSVKLLSHVWLFATPQTTAGQASLSITYSRSLLKLMFIELDMPSNHHILCRHLLLLLPIFPSIRVFSSQSVLHTRWPKYWSFSSSNEYSGLISFVMDWLDLLAVQRTLKSLLQHHSSKASILWCSAFFIVQLSHPYMTTGKTIYLTRWTFVGKVMSLLFNMLSRLVIAFLPKSLLISWVQSPSVVISEPKNIVSNCFHCFPHLFAMKWWDQMPWSWFSECWVLSPANVGRCKNSSPGLGWSPGQSRATHSSIFVWRIPWTEEPGRLQSIGSQRIRYDCSDLACMYARYDKTMIFFVCLYHIGDKFCIKVQLSIGIYS